MNRRTHPIALLLMFLAAFACFGAQEVPQPLPGTFVHDFAGVIPDDKKAEIQAKAQRLKDEFKTEIAVVTIDSLQGEESFDYSMRMARAWGIGSKDNDIRGLLILIAVKDRKTAFRTSRHIEGELTDSVTGEISRGMNASFKKGDFGGGVSAGMDMILDRLNGVYEPRTGAGQTNNHSLPWWLPYVVAFISITSLGLIFFVIRHLKLKERAWIAAGHTEASYYASSNYNSSSSNSSSSSSSGSSYGGGSDFGGGGSDSSW